MSPQAQRAAIAEALGWQVENYGPHGYEKLYWRLRKPDGIVHCDACTGEEWSRLMFSAMVPAYLHDLNAMNEAERVCIIGNHNLYSGDTSIERAYRDKCGTFSTASQRAEAFLRTLGKWDDAK